LALEIKRQSGRWRAGGLGNAGYCRAAGGQNDAGPASVAFQHGEHRMSGGLAGKRKPDVEPLRDGYWEATCHHRFGLNPSTAISSPLSWPS
jgi:hypothetical protein